MDYCWVKRVGDKVDGHKTLTAVGEVFASTNKETTTRGWRLSSPERKMPARKIFESESIKLSVTLL